MVINQKKPKFIFAHLEKTGGTFVEQYLCNIFKIKKGTITPSLNSNAEIKKICKHDSLIRFEEKNKELIKFGFIRNPYDWYLSLWCFSHNHKVYTRFYKFDKDKTINDFIRFLSETKLSLCYHSHNVQEDKICRTELDHIDMDFANKLDIGLLTYRYLSVFHHHDVFEDLDNHREYMLADRILRFEDLRKELDKFFMERIVRFDKKQLGLLYTKKRTRTTSHRHYSEGYYNKESIDLIKHKDRIIFDTYGYEF